MREWLLLCLLMAFVCAGCGGGAVEANAAAPQVPNAPSLPAGGDVRDSEPLGLGGYDFSVRGGGPDSDGNWLEDRCLTLAPLPGKGRADGLMKVVCGQDGACSEVFFPVPEGFACSAGRFIRLPAPRVSPPAAGDPGCREVLPGHNDPAANRYNLIFVGSDYHRIEPQRPQEGRDAFLWDIRAMLGEGSRRGFFDYEPFKRRKDRFNLWYVERFNEMDPVTEPYGYAEHEARNRRGDAAARPLVQACAAALGLKNAKMVHLVANRGNLDSSITIATFRETQLFNPAGHAACVDAVAHGVSLLLEGDDDGCLSLEDNPPSGNPDAVSFGSYRAGLDYDGNGRVGSEDRDLFAAVTRLSHRVDLCEGEAGFEETVRNACANGLNNLGRTFSHGATLLHEFGHHFLAYDARQTPSVPDAGWEGVTVGNCFIASSREACLERAPWQGMIGDGCGKPGVEDCAPSHPDYALEVGCFEGCIAGVTSFRSVRAGSYEYGIPGQSGTSRRELGLWNESYLGKAVDGILKLPLFQ